MVVTAVVAGALSVGQRAGLDGKVCLEDAEGEAEFIYVDGAARLGWNGGGCMHDL